MFRSVLLLAALLCLALSSVAVADELPLWEAGLGVAGLSLPDYRGSDEQRGYVLPFPYLVYRGEIFRLDRKGLYGILFESKRVQLNISADAGVPVRSSRNSARTGMPNLDPTFQIGPSLEVCLFTNCDSDRVMQIRLPVRTVFASNFSYLAAIGFVANPQLNFDFRNLGPGSGWNFGFALGPLYATKKYHEYYYQVDSQYAIPGVRAPYDAKGGYSGALIIFTLSKRFEKVWFG
ncbi:MAG: MipA/OmpV family protein, partial [Betaproteobacteria bacterium]